MFVKWLTYEKPADEFPLCDFDKIRYELRPGDVLLIEGRSRVSEVIKQITLSPWSHASIYIGRLHDIEDPVLRDKLLAFHPFPPNTQLVIESYIGRGTIATALEDYRKDHIRLCRPKGLSRQDASAVVAYAIQKLGTPYAVRQVFDLARFLIPWSFLPRRWRSSLFEQHVGEPTRTICSVMIAEAFGAIDFPILPVIKSHDTTGVELFMRNPRIFTPRDFDYSPYFEIIKFPFISYTESPYRQLPWNRTGMMSYDGLEVVDPLNPPVKAKKKYRFRLKKKLINPAETYGDTTPTLQDDQHPIESAMDISPIVADLEVPRKEGKKYRLFGKISIRFPSIHD